MENSEKIEFLRSLYLFNSLTDEELERVVGYFKEKRFSKGKYIFKENDLGDFFHIVISGTINLSNEDGHIGTIGRKEYLGGGALLQKKPRTTTARSISDTYLLSVNQTAFDKLLIDYPQIKGLLNLLTKSYSIARRKTFPWLGEDEVIRLIDQKHVAVLFGKLLIPVILLMALFAILPITLLSKPFFAIIVLIILLFWGLWVWVDWGNDYYIVTDKRIVWLEKTVWFYDQRREAPLQTILSANASTNQIQRLLNYADVIVRTYTGEIVMRNAAHPRDLEGMVKAYWYLAKERTEEEDTSQITQTIRSRLGFEEMGTEKVETYKSEEFFKEEEILTDEPSTILPPILGNLFKTRYEYNGVITYRKHLYILIKQIWIYLLIYMGLFLFLVASAVNLVTFPTFKSLLALTGVYTLISSPFWVYRFFDWKNDRYQLTDKEIIDLDKKPLGRETRRSAPLENILSMDYQRENILQRTLNFGTVVINVGDARFDFEMVVNPSMVQKEIFEHYYAALQRKEEKDTRRRRDDMVEFLAIYHNENERYQNSQDYSEGSE